MCVKFAHVKDRGIYNMNNKLVSFTETAVQMVFDWNATFAETKELVKEDAELTVTIDDAMVKRFHGRVKIGFNLIALQKEHSKNGYGDFTTVVLPEMGINERFAQRCISVARLCQNSMPTSLSASIFDLPMPMDTWNRLASPSGQTVVQQLESGEIALTQEAITQALEEGRARLAEERRCNEELKEANQELQRSFYLFKEDKEREQQIFENKLKAVENEKAAKESEILNYKQTHAAIGNQMRLNTEELAQLQERLQNEAKQTLDQELKRQEQEQETKLKTKKKELEKELEQKYQLEAENTIHSLLSHGIKRMAEAQLTIEHIVSAGMLQAVQQLGGKQVRSFLAQAASLQEELDRVIAKLTQGDYLELTERAG
jgi:hypothetical protein